MNKTIETILKLKPEILLELGECLHEKIKVTVIPEWQAAFQELTLKDCVDYIRNLAINRTFDGYLHEKSVINDGLVKIFPKVRFVESDTDLDHAADIDYLGFVGQFAFGIQIKPVTVKSNFGNYSPTERMRANFKDFEEKYKGKVFVVYSLYGEIANNEVISQIENEIKIIENKIKI